MTFRLTDGSFAKLKIHRRCICQKKFERLSTGLLESAAVDGHSHFRFNRVTRQAMDEDNRARRQTMNVQEPRRKGENRE